MKKLFLVLLSLVVLFCILVYAFIPGKFNVSVSTRIPASESGTQRVILDANHWSKWWNNSDDSVVAGTVNPAAFTANNDIFILTGVFYKRAQIDILHEGRHIPTEMLIVSLDIDSTGVEWRYTVPGSLNPFKRFAQYREAIEVKKNMGLVLDRLQQFLSKIENIYGITVERVSTNDTLLVSAKTTLPERPSTPGIYRLVGKIQAYLLKNGAKQGGNPIYNLTKIDSGNWQLMVAVPVTKEVPENDQFVIKKMVRGSFMVTEVTGGEHTVETAARNLQQYFDDYRKTSMAIPFTMLVTDRMYQPDTSKWITKIYQPVY